MQNIEYLVVFAILMENGQGIIDKAPSYIYEKWRLCRTCKAREHLDQLLDPHNSVKYHTWLNDWLGEP